MSQSLRDLLKRELRRLQALPKKELLERRYQKWMAMGAYPSK
jgi:acetyl-CoA carboxylase alpha subunit